MALDAPSWLKSIRESNTDRFNDSAFPNYKEEAWRFTNVSDIVNTPFRSLVEKPGATVAPEDVAPYLFDEPDWPQLVFVDGFYSKDLSRIGKARQGLHAGSLAEAIASGSDVVKRNLNRVVDPISAFISLNSAFIQDGAFVHIKANEILECPIHLLFVSTGTASAATHPRNLVVVGASSESIVLENHVGLGKDANQFNNGVTEICIEDNARLSHYKVVREGDGTYHLWTTNIRQGRDTRLESFAITLSGKIVRNELRVAFEDEGSECRLNGLYLNDGSRLIDNALNVEHNSPRCRSRMVYKGILDGKSSAVFTGKVLVRQYSQRTDSDQLNKNLLLSSEATIDTKPQLEIFADDVKCTHGATIGSFPKELLFYFQSRGIDPEQAHGILTYGFAGDIIDEIKISALRELLDAYVFKKYNPER